MGKIIELPQSVISQIAAGEVIERPAYAVKELIENAIDALATHIKIIVEEAGLKLISVIDNGMGMDTDDLVLSVKPHTTSKITGDGLSRITSFGFRGEALSSIAAISSLTISSRRQQDKYGGKIISRGPTSSQDYSLDQPIRGRTSNQNAVLSIGMPYGTVVTIQSIFSSVPARKKFLKSEKTEFRHIIDIVTNLALAHPTIRFSLTHNSKHILDTVENSTLAHRVHQLLGAYTYAQLLPVDFEDSYISVKGYIGKPQSATANQSKQFTLIHNRPVTDSLVASAVKEAYGILLAPRSYPIFILFITLPHDMVDVNIHPRKEQIKFIENTFVFDSVKQAVVQTLEKSNLTYIDNTMDPPPFTQQTETFSGRDTESFAGQLLKSAVLTQQQTSIENKNRCLLIHNNYLLFQADDGLVMIDQHAAHERLLYEQFISTFIDKQSAGNKLRLKNPAIIELSVADAEIISEYIPTLNELGFEIESFGVNTCKVTTVPELFKDRNIRALFTEAIEDIRTKGTISDIDSRTKKMLAYLACRSAIMAGEPLNQEQARQLVEDLDKTPNAYTCPHGRPTRVHIPITHIHRLFKRK